MISFWQENKLDGTKYSEDDYATLSFGLTILRYVLLILTVILKVEVPVTNGSLETICNITRSK